MGMSVNQMVLGYIAFYLNPTYFMYMTALIFRWKCYFIMEDRETSNNMLKKLKKEVWTTTTYSVQNRNCIGGYFIGWRCAGYVEHTFSFEEIKIHLFASPAFFDYLKSTPEVTTEPKPLPVAASKKNVKIDVFVRKGTYKNFYYNKLKLDLAHVNPVGDQAAIVQGIADIYDRLGRATVFVDGVTNAGKSTLGFLAAKELGGAYCHTFNPTEPGDHMTTVTMEHLFDDGPLVIVLEEADDIIKKIHVGAVVLNAETPTLVYNKPTWSSFLDDMLFYKKVVLILTSNTPKADLDALDPAYLRSGRVHAAYSMPDPLPTNA